MRKPLLFVIGVASVALVLVCAAPRPAKAIKQFKDQFEAKYVKPDSNDPKDKAFAAEVQKVKCLVCHEGTSKKNHNVYGKALKKLLNRQTDRDNKEKIQKALDTVATEKADPNVPDSPTFGQLIASGKLPGGEPKQGSAPK